VIKITLNYPKISVLMPIYKDHRFLDQAIESILSQTYKDFELIIICDDPDEDIFRILNSYQKKDNRIKIFYQNRLGLIASLNLGCMLSKGQYIARMDADDICLPNRLKTQLDFFESHPEIGIAGTWIQQIDEKGHYIRDIQFPTSHNAIRFELIFSDCIAHPTVMMRKEIAEILGYRHDASLCEDYDLWARACLRTKIANMSEVLLKYRIHDQNVSRQNLCNNTIPEIRYALISHLGLKANKEDVIKLYKIESGLADISMTDYKFAISIIYELEASYTGTNSLEINELRDIKKAVARLFSLLAYRAIMASSFLIASKFLFHGFLSYPAIIFYPFSMIYNIIFRNLLRLRDNLKNFCSGIVVY
jgi:glycosyltransferase involved in cell wall biosynthesis